MESDKIVLLQAKKIEELNKIIRAQEQEIFLLNEEIRRLKRANKKSII